MGWCVKKQGRREALVCRRGKKAAQRWATAFERKNARARTRVVKCPCVRG